METTKISIQASISANLQKVWNYYTQPEHITKWNFASPEWHCPSASNDMKVGGKYIARMEAKDGSFGFDFEATYSEITENKKFIYNAGWSRSISQHDRRSTTDQYFGVLRC
ncbi:MAG: SRPBCC domain-containing protein [Paludibacteraceae bacterium]|nr:SRPBCC domain-containing protein [Paludibacteraceae bacterium]